MGPVSFALSSQACWHDNNDSICWATDQPSGTTTARSARNPGSIPPGDVPQSPDPTPNAPLGTTRTPLGTTPTLRLPLHRAGLGPSLDPGFWAPPLLWEYRRHRGVSMEARRGAGAPFCDERKCFPLRLHSLGCRSGSPTHPDPSL